MRVRDIMTVPPITVLDTSSLADSIRSMILHRLNALPVLNSVGGLCGIISEGDCLHRTEIGTTKRSKSKLSEWFSPEDTAISYRRAYGRQVVEIMSAPVITIDDTETLAVAADRMDRHQIKCLPVMHDGDLVGVISRFDLMRALQMFLVPAYEEQATSDGEIKERIITEVNHHRWAAYCSLDIVVNSGQVTLRGTAGNGDQRVGIGVAAENVVGVQSVVNEIVLLEPVVIPGL